MRLARPCTLLAALLAASSALLGARAVAAPVPLDVAQDDAPATLDAVTDAISELRLNDAEALLAQLDPNRPAALFEQARLCFHRGQYAEAVATADRALLTAKGHERTRMESGRALFASTLEVTKDFEHKTSADGRYVVSYPKGKDALIAGYALTVLQLADAALTKLLGVSLDPPLRLEVYASPQDLARVSSLTVEQIETTGTVALSKWNRLMITSPKALVRGYPWADTITHELVHMVLSRASGDRAPVWLQEGTAKLFERSWRTHDTDLVLDSGARALLADRNGKGTLLTFEQMHPSIAMLPSEDDAALAFAQVSTFMQRYVAEHGAGALRDTLARIKGGADAKVALAGAAETTFAKLEAAWKTALPRSAQGEDQRLLGMRFKQGDGPTDDSKDVVLDKARRHLRIGDLLWDRGRTTAAAREYEKAYHEDTLDPIVAARWARTALQIGQTQAVVEALEPQVQRHPGYAPSHALLGRAQLLLGDLGAAREALREAIWINPFDPDPHCDLVRATDLPAERDDERRACDGLR